MSGKITNYSDLLLLHNMLIIIGNCLAKGGNVELNVNVFDVAVDGAIADVQHICNHFVIPK